MPNPALVSADFIIGGKPDFEKDDDEEEEEKEEDENRDDAIVVVVCAPPPRDDERPLRGDFPPKPSFFLRIAQRFQNSSPRRRKRLLPPPALHPPPELNASAPNFPKSTNRIVLFFYRIIKSCYKIALFFSEVKKKRRCIIARS